MTVEEVATLASRFGWSYETLMAMSGAERRLWLRAADAVAKPPSVKSPPAGVGATPGPPPAAPTRLTEAERRAQLLEVAKGFAARYER
jgi:hypothetical protein